MLPNPRHLYIILAAFLLWLLPLALGDLPTSRDWEPIFWPAIREAASGGNPYGVPLATHPMHLYILMAWAAALPADAALVVWMALSLGILAVAAWHLTDRGWPALLAIMFSPLLLHLFRMGNVTALEVAGIALLVAGVRRESLACMSLSIVFLTAVPPNTLPLLAWGILRRRWAGLAVGVMVGVLILLGTMALYGNWLPSWVESMKATRALQERDYYMDLWRWGWEVMIPVLTIMALATYHYREAFPRLSVEAQALFVLASTYMVTPYLLNYRILPLYVLTVAVLSRRGKYLPLILLAFGYGCLIASLQPGHLYEIVLLVPFAYVVSLVELHYATLTPPEPEEVKGEIYV